MTDENGSQNFSKNCNSEEIPDPSSDINPSQEQRTQDLAARLPGRTPQSLIEWLARINRRYLAISQEKTNDTN